MSRRSTNPIIGGFTVGDLKIFIPIVVLGGILSAAIFGWIVEPVYFRFIAASNPDMNYAFIFNHWSLFCIGMLGLILIIVFLPAIINLLRFGWTPQTQVYFIAGTVAGLLWVIVEDFTAHLAYGSCPPDDWTHWILQAHIQLWTDFWLPTWMLIIGLLIVTIIVGFGWFYLPERRGGGRQ